MAYFHFLVTLLNFSMMITFKFIRFNWHRRKKSSSRKDEVVNPFEVRMMLTDMNSPSHTFLPQQSNGAAERQTLMPDVVGYEHQGK